jgi:predicted NBD/HSP70 family sugar kinase
MVLTDAAELIGQALSAVHTIFNPERVVIGGALTGIAPGLVDKIVAALPKYCRAAPDGGSGALPRLVAGTLGMNASALGAVGLVLTELASEAAVPH